MVYKRQKLTQIETWKQTTNKSNQREREREFVNTYIFTNCATISIIS